MEDDYIVRVSWDEVGFYLNSIAEQIDPHDYVGVYGIPRGGSVLAAWLSHKLYLPLLTVPEKRCLVIDDICDSGETLSSCLRQLESLGDNSSWITTMFCTPRILSGKLDYYFKAKGDNWIVFPWEQ